MCLLLPVLCSDLFESFLHTCRIELRVKSALPRMTDAVEDGTRQRIVEMHSDAFNG